MGGAISCGKRMLRMEKEETSFLMLGLDSAGKTTILHKLRGVFGEVVATIPTIGFNVELAKIHASKCVINFTCWDVGGREKIRALCRHYYADQSALIFVVDCSDKSCWGIEQAHDQLQEMLAEEKLQGKPLLVFANKQDKPGAKSSSQVIEELGLHRIRTRLWFVQASVATTGEGLLEGLDWLSKAVRGQVVPGSSEVASEVALAQAGSSLPVGAGASLAAARLKEGSDGGSAAETASTADTEPAEEGELAVSTAEHAPAEEGDLAVST